MLSIERHQGDIIVCLLLVCLLFGCQDNYSSVSFVKVETERTKLIDEIESYQSIDAFRGFLHRRSIKYEVNKNSQSSSKGRPPFEMCTVTIKDYSHLGFNGELSVGFFNDRLMGTTFYPVEVEEYAEALAKLDGIRFNNSREVNIPPYTRIYFSTDYRGQRYVRWSDIRLDKEVELWIKRYS
jgi:hypothetical protein